jgi:hypothetical protein
VLKRGGIGIAPERGNIWIERHLQLRIAGKGTCGRGQILLQFEACVRSGCFVPLLLAALHALRVRPEGQPFGAVPDHTFRIPLLNRAADLTSVTARIHLPSSYVRILAGAGRILQPPAGVFLYDLSR